MAYSEQQNMVKPNSAKQKQFPGCNSLVLFSCLGVVTVCDQMLCWPGPLNYSDEQSLYSLLLFDIVRNELLSC